MRFFFQVLTAERQLERDELCFCFTELIHSEIIGKGIVVEIEIDFYVGWCGNDDPSARWLNVKLTIADCCVRMQKRKKDRN